MSSTSHLDAQIPELGRFQQYFCGAHPAPALTPAELFYSLAA
jgi:hypothetical protein